MQNFFQELKRRNVIRTGIAYVVAAWLIVEVTSVVAPAYNAPQWVLQLVIALLLLGLPVALLFSWAYEMTPDGLKPETEVGPGESEPQKTARRLDVITIGLLVITLGFVLADRFLLRDRHPVVLPEETALDQVNAEPGEVIPTMVPLSAEHSIAVLPFQNMSGDPDQAFLADGVHEALLTDLAKIADLRVISRTSVMQFRDAEKSLPEIAQELGVNWIIEGSVLPIGAKVRITAQLIDAANDEHQWAESYDRDLENLLALMSTVARTIAAEVQVALSPHESARLTSAETVDPRAQEAYLKGRYHSNRLDGDSLQRAMEYFEQAIEFEPGFARAHASLAGTYFVRGLFRLIPRSEALELARAGAARALELDQDVGTAHVVLGFISLYADWDWEAAERYARRALELEPNNWNSIHLFADCLGVRGRIHESVEWMRLGQLIDPLSPIANNSLLAHLFYSEQYETVIREFGAPEESGSESSASFVRRALWQAGEFDRAAELYLEMLNSRDQKHIASAFKAGWESSGPEGAMAAAASAMEAQPQSDRPDNLTLAIYHARGGNEERSIALLQQAFEEKSWGLIHIKVIPEFGILHAQPGFQALVEGMGLSSNAEVR